MKTRNIGRFKITRFVYESLCKPGNESMRASFFEKIMPIQIENNFYDDTYEFVAESSQFRVLSQGEIMPDYTFEIITDTDNTPSFLFKEIGIR